MAPRLPGMADRLLRAMTSAGARGCGAERVSELAHALQCAELARAAGADEELTVACLLHDVGRFAVDPAQLSDRVGGERTVGARGHHEVGADLDQGGLMTRDEIARHATHPWLGDALRLRRWDDLAKVVGKETAPLAAWEPLLRAYFR